MSLNPAGKKSLEVAKTLMGLKKCSLCRGRGIMHVQTRYTGEIAEEACHYCKGTGWVVPRIVKAQ